MTGSLRPRLMVLQGGQVVGSREITPGEAWTLGRGADAALPLAERSISRNHARVVCDAAGVHLEDLGTPNGTFVDEERVEGSVTLRDGNVIRLGQSTNPDPILVRFEDPGSRLLDAMVSAPPPAAAPPPAPPAPPAARTAPPAARTAPPAAPPSAPGAAPPATPPSEEAAPPTPAAPHAPAAEPDEADAPTFIAPFPGPAGAPAASPFGSLAPPEPGDEGLLAPPTPAGADGFEPAGEPPPPEPPAALGGLRGRLSRRALLWAAGLGLLLWGFVALLQSTQKPWQSVRVEPPRVQSGTRVSIRGVEVEPAEDMIVTVDGTPGTIDEMKPGELLFSAPELIGSEAGVRAVSLRVERNGIALLSQTLQYETRPEISAVVPEQAAVGDTVAVTGHGFAAQASRLEVVVNSAPAEVVSASLERIEFRVPVVTRYASLDAAVVVRVAGYATSPARLRVDAREAPCYDLAFTARNVAPRVWEIRHAFGPALLLEGPSSGDAVPAAVESAVTRLRDAFEQAREDPGVAFEVRESRTPTLVSVGGSSSRNEIARWSGRLDDYLHERVPELRQTQLMPFWSAVVLNELLDVFAKKQAPSLLPAGNPLRDALDRLHQLNVETGGQGCPADAEMATLLPGERYAFENAMLRVPARFGEVGGVWEGKFEDIFSENPTETRFELRLELDQTGTQLAGRAFVYEVRGPGIRWSPPPIQGFEGRVRLSAETRVELTVPPVPPYFFTRLDGVVVNDAFTGTYRTNRNKQGAFQLVYNPSR